MGSYLKISNLWHRYSSNSGHGWCLSNINLTINPGELVGLVGPSGCGKTTLLRLIAGFETPARGSIELDHKEVSSPKSVLPPEERGIGMVFQDYALFPHLTVWQNVVFGLSPGQDSGRALWLLELLELSQFCSRYPHELSGGQKQRLALARSLTAGASLLVLDEPFCSLDAVVRIKLRNELSFVLKSCSVSCLLVTHDPQEALSICDRIAVMSEGHIHQFSPPKEIVQKPLTPFVGKFFFGKNSLPVEYFNGNYLTILGKIRIEPIQPFLEERSFMFDKDAVKVIPNKTGNAIIISREFHNQYWILSVKIEDHNLRVIYSLENELKVGDRCDLCFHNDQQGILFPDVKPCFTI